jgi:hypothetical protein
LIVTRLPAVYWTLKEAGLSTEARHKSSLPSRKCY